mgnify:CR=1 FL=1
MPEQIADEIKDTRVEQLMLTQQKIAFENSDYMPNLQAINILRTSQEFTICTATGTQESPAIDGGIVVWEDFRGTGSEYDIYGRQVRFPVWLPLTLRNYNP